jgi:hypothetical protein
MPYQNLTKTVTQAFTFARKMAPKKFVSIQKNGPEFGRTYKNKLILHDRQLKTIDFARPVLLDVTLLAIGAPGCKDADGNKIGAIYLYKGGNYEGIDKNWKKKYKFFYPLTGNENNLPLDGSAVDFGASVAMTTDGDMLVVGAPGERSEVGDRTGAVYVFNISENSHELMAKILPIDPVAGREFGKSVALSDDGNMLWICDKKIDKLSKVYTYTRPANDPSSWFFDFKRTTKNDVATFFSYKTKILRQDKTLPERVAYMDATGAATPFVFLMKENIEPLTMSQSIQVLFCSKNKIDRILKQKSIIFDPNISSPEDCFGHSICASPPFLYRVAIGAPGKNDKTGCVYVYIYNGTDFSLFNELVPDDAEQDDKFGFSCASSSEMEVAPCHLYAIADSISPEGPFTKTSSWSTTFTVKRI